MGVVYRAEQIALERPVAIKLLLPHLRSDPRVLERFLAEARVASRLNHPSSVGIIDFGVTDEEVPYIVMEYIDGADLGSILQAEGRLEAARVCHIALATLGALGEAHALGVVHRDLKPENVIVARRRGGLETVKVVDFGLAQIASRTSRCTEPGFALGTPQYMAPEQFEDAPVDARADLYSLGVMMFELATGTLPFAGPAPADFIRQHADEPPPDPRRLAPTMPPALAEIILRSLAKRPEDRYPSAGAMAEAVERAARAHSIRLSSGVRCAACSAAMAEDAVACAACGGPRSRAEQPPAEPMSPLHERLWRLAGPGSGGARRSLADAVSLLVDRLEPRSRTLLQAIAVLGEPAPLGALEAIAGAWDATRVEALRASGLIEELGIDSASMHRRVREVILASTPVEVLRCLHDRALAWHQERGGPLEVRAEHAHRAGQADLALLLFDQAGQVAERRADAEAAIGAFGRALELSRREMARTGDEHLARAILSFSVALARVLRAAGRGAEADGALAEALEHAPPRSEHRAELWLALGRGALDRRDYERALAAARQAAACAVWSRDALRDEVESLVREAKSRLPGAEVDAPPRSRASTELVARPLSILVVEDDPDTQEALRSAMEAEGHRVHCASNGKHALRLLSRIDPPSGIVVDLMMPVMDGWELIEALRADAAYRAIPVAVLSAISDRAPPGARRVKKPVALPDLLDVLAGFDPAAGEQSA